MLQLLVEAVAVVLRLPLPPPFCRDGRMMSKVHAYSSIYVAIVFSSDVVVQSW